jgi:hypothetical protein
MERGPGFGVRTRWDDEHEVESECKGIEKQAFEVSDRLSSTNRESHPEVSIRKELVKTSLDLESRISW